MRRPYLWLFLIFLLASLSFWLTGCASKVDPQNVLGKFSKSLGSLTSFSGQFIFSDNLNQMNSQSIKWDGSLDIKDFNNPKTSGALSLQTQSENGPLSLKFDLRRLGDFSYFRLSSVESPQFSPLFLTTTQKWYRITDGGSGNNETAGKWLGLKFNLPWSQSQDKKLRTFLASNDLFEVNKYVGKESVMGVVSYHLQVQARENVFKELANLWGELNNQSVDANAFVQLVDRFTNKGIDLWVAVKDGHPVKLKVQGTGSLDPYPNPKTQIELTLSGYNIPVKVEPPQQSEEFLGNLMGMMGK